MVPAHHQARIISFSTGLFKCFFPKYSVTRKERVKHKNSHYRFYSKEPLSSIDDWKKSLCQWPIHSRHAPSLKIKTLDGGNHKTQNHHQSVVNSISLCYVPDQFIVKSTKRHCTLHRRILKERTQWEGCSVEDYLKNTVQRIILLAKKDELELLQNYTINSNLELTRTKIDSSWISFTHLL